MAAPMKFLSGTETSTLSTITAPAATLRRGMLKPAMRSCVPTKSSAIAASSFIREIAVACRLLAPVER